MPSLHTPKVGNGIVRKTRIENLAQTGEKMMRWLCDCNGIRRRVVNPWLNEAGSFGLKNEQAFALFSGFSFFDLADDSAAACQALFG